jgi:signal transduction histidine kinase
MGAEKLAFAAVSTRLLWGVVSCAFACIAPAVTAGAESLPRSVLFLDHNGPSEPFGQGMSAAFHTTISAGSPEHVAIYAETLDLIRSSGSGYNKVLKTYLREKYQDIPIGVIVGPGTAALRFMLPARAEIWPKVPAIFVSNPEAAAEAQNLQGVTGLVRRQPLQDSVRAAQALMPGLKSIALVGDVPRQQYQRARFKEEITALADVEIIDLTGLRMAELLQRVAALPNRTAIYFTTLTFDGDRPAYVSRDALVSIAEVANRPIIVDLETHVGGGSVGGLVADPGAIGRELARLALRILDGESTSNIPVVNGDFVGPIFDARQLQKWGISESNLPKGSEIRFRQPTAWDQYHWQIMLIAGALLLQTGLIIGLIYEHRRRQIAEADSLQRVNELARMNRFATAGELSASIAHEIRQPLTAISISGQAALSWLKRQVPNLDEARKALGTVITESHHADDVIKSVRAMFKHESTARSEVNLNELFQQVIAVTARPIDSNNIVLETHLVDDAARHG